MARKNHAKHPGAGDSSTAMTRKALPASREVSRAPTFVSLYANDIQIHTSPWDLRFILGELTDPVEGQTPTIKVNQTGELRMSPQLAKKLVELIQAQLTAY